MKRWGILLLCLGLAGFAVMIPIAALAQDQGPPEGGGPPPAGCQRNPGSITVNGNTLTFSVSGNTVTVTNTGDETVSGVLRISGGGNVAVHSFTLGPGESETFSGPNNPAGNPADVSHFDVCSVTVVAATTTAPPTTTQVGGQRVVRRVVTRVVQRPVVVRGRTVVRPVVVRQPVVAAPAAVARPLPFTGIDPSPFLTASGLLMSSGGGLLLASRRRRRQ